MNFLSMGLFLSLSGVIGRTHNEVERSLRNYAESAGGSLQIAIPDNDHATSCVIKEANGNTTVLYPSDHFDWDRSSQFLSKELKAPVFSLHIHDGDLWLYVFYFNGEIVDQFNPVPAYWDEHISEEEIDSWKGNALLLEKYIPFLKARSIEKYLVRWDLNAEGEKAYETDRFFNEDQQLIDFMDKLGLQYPLDDSGNPTGDIYRSWTNEQVIPKQAGSKKWWKFW